MYDAYKHLENTGISASYVVKPRRYMETNSAPAQRTTQTCYILGGPSHYIRYSYVLAFKDPSDSRNPITPNIPTQCHQNPQSSPLSTSPPPSTMTRKSSPFLLLYRYALKKPDHWLELAVLLFPSARPHSNPNLTHPQLSLHPPHPPRPHLAQHPHNRRIPRHRPRHSRLLRQIRRRRPRASCAWISRGDSGDGGESEDESGVEGRVCEM